MSINAHSDQSERLQKVAAAAGLGSRRGLEKLIDRGEFKINNRVAKLGVSVRENDTIDWQGKQWTVVPKEDESSRVLIYFKPEGEVTTHSDPEGRRTVFARLPRLEGARWINIGRLDINTSGLLLLTTDGELANRMMHPSGGVDREYLCRVYGPVSDDTVDVLKKGVTLEDGPAHFSDIQRGESSGSNQWFYVVLLEGRNREVRRLWEAVGHQVSRLKRVRYGPVFLPKGLRSGQYQELPTKDVQTLRGDVGLSANMAGLTLEPVKSSGRDRSGKNQT